MTDRRTELQRSKRRTALAVYATSAALFAIVGGSLGVRMAQGHDPSLGSLGAQVTHPDARKHNGHWTTKALRTTSSGRVIQTAQPSTAGATGGAAPTHVIQRHTPEGHDA